MPGSNAFPRQLLDLDVDLTWSIEHDQNADFGLLEQLVERLQRENR